MWIELTLPRAPAAARDLIIEFIVEQGASGFEEKSSGEYVTHLSEGEYRGMEPLLHEYQRELIASGLLSEPVSLSVAEYTDQGWSEKWKEFYLPQALGERFFLIPLWDKKTICPPNRISIRMEPGQAFGTGLHPSTRLALGQLEVIAEKFPERDLSVLDVGTGSGLLAIAATKLGFSPVLAFDNDPVAVGVASDNLKENQCESVRIFESQGSTGIEGSFDVVVANILLEVHARLISQYAQWVSPGGQLVLSGLLRHEAQVADRLLRSFDFIPQEHREENEWYVVRACKNENPPSQLLHS